MVINARGLQLALCTVHATFDQHEGKCTDVDTPNPPAVVRLINTITNTVHQLACVVAGCSIKLHWTASQPVLCIIEHVLPQAVHACSSATALSCDITMQVEDFRLF
jgi:hypothetical protein